MQRPLLLAQSWNCPERARVDDPEPGCACGALPEARSPTPAPSRVVEPVTEWSESSHSPSHCMVRVIAWSKSSHGPSHRMVRVIAWSELPHVPSHRMVRVTAWSGDARRRTLGRARYGSRIAFAQCSRMPAIYRKQTSVCVPKARPFQMLQKSPESHRPASAPPSPRLMCASSKRRDRLSQAR